MKQKSQSALPCRTVVRVVRKSIENSTFAFAATEKNPQPIDTKFGMGDYVRDATQYPKWHVDRFRGGDPHEGVKC